MSTPLDFEATWLALREPADVRSRAAALEARLGAALREGAGPRSAVDLGSGTGANLRHLGPRLRGLHWTAVDRNPGHLAAATLPPGLAVERRVLDLATELEAALTPAPDLATASAFLDLVSAAWVARFVAATAPSWVLVALTVDGRVALTPEVPGDDAVLAALAHDQRTDKLAGEALGGAAAGALVSAARAAGRRAWMAPSDWWLGPGDGALQRALLEGYARVARGHRPEAEVDAWHRARRAALVAGTSRVRVGHQDVLVAPAAKAHS